jgi:6-phosphogluconolactonase
MKKNLKGKIKVFDTAIQLNESAAEFIINLAKRSIKERGRFVLCLSGGNTPKGLYQLLSEMPYINKMPWNFTFIFWGDERCVPADDERNNAHMARVTLLNKTGIPLSHIFTVPTELSAVDAAKKYEKTIKGFYCSSQPRFDLILLGLGEDGHTASLFPRTAALHETKRLVKAVCIENQQINRITITPPLINIARHILFLVTGANKSAILNKILHVAYDPEIYPVQLIKPEDGELDWFVDKGAAEQLGIN